MSDTPEQVSMREVFALAIETERNGREFYRAAAAAAGDPEVQRLMRHLAEAEGEHEAAFRRMLAEAFPPPDAAEAPAAPPVEVISAEQQEYLAALLRSRVLPDRDTALRVVAEMADGLAALDFAIAFEKDTILLMHQLQEMLAEANREPLARLIQQEHIHVRLLQQFQDMRR